jgi:predicted Zn-dependent peptidase
MSMGSRTPAVVKVDRSRLPDATRSAVVAFPAINKSTLRGGLHVWTVPHTAVPLVSFMVLLRAGSASDPETQEGLAALTADMLDEGSGARSAIDMHEAIATIGAQFDTDIGSDAAMVAITSLSKFAEPSLTLLGDIVARPALREGDFARVRQLRLHRFMQLRDVPGAVADRTFLRMLYGPQPYGHTPIGTEKAVMALTADDVRHFHAAAIRPGTATLIAVGDCRHDDVVRLAAAAFEGWGSEADAVATSAGESAPPANTTRLIVVPRPGAPQSELRIGHVAAARHTPDYHALVAANMVLGGQFVSRINLNLREDKGFTYGARTAFDFRRMPGPFSLQASVQTGATVRAIEESLGEIEAIRGPRPATADELSLAVAALTRGYARNFETAEQIARAVTQIALYDLPDDYFEQYVRCMEAVTAADITRVMAAHVDPSRLVTLVVGDLDVIGADLARLGLGEPLVLSADAF